MTDKIKKYGLIGAPQSKAGGVETKGVVELPNILRSAGIVDIIKACDADVEDFGDAFESDIFDHYYETNAYAKSQDTSTIFRYVKNGEIIGKNCYQLYLKVKEALEKKTIPIIFGGDHGIATGSIAASLEKHPDLIVLFVDAHTDINTPDTTIHGHYQGMLMAHLTGMLKVKGFEWLEDIPKLNPKNLLYFGIRALYQVDKNVLDKFEIPYYTMHDIKHYGISKSIQAALNHVDPTGKKPIHLSFDIDCCDHLIAPGTIGPIEGGFSYSEVLYLAHFLNKTDRIVSMDIVEVNTDLDEPQTVEFQYRLPIKRQIGKTVKLAINILSNLVVGKGIIAPQEYSIA